MKPQISQSSSSREFAVPSALPSRIFVTGTDTNVGKTVVSAMMTIGLNAHYWKPIQSGTADGTDSEWIRTVSKLSRDHFIPEAYSLRAPLSPHAAAQLEEVKIDLDTLILPEVEPLVVEGAGGIMVPLNENQYMLDLICKFALPTIIVARSGLGTINHTLLTIDKLRSAGVEILGVVMNGEKNLSNRIALEHYSQVSVLAELPQIESLSLESLQAQFEKYFVKEGVIQTAPNAVQNDLDVSKSVSTKTAVKAS
ncbi:MAG: dethiobiotin synthase [Candidatus Melainabacteria bacterium]|nr:dethiobiotin synthase [Candidatus Melainabacteria bacterium]